MVEVVAPLFSGIKNKKMACTLATWKHGLDTGSNMAVDKRGKGDFNLWPDELTHLNINLSPCQLLTQLTQKHQEKP